MLRTYENANCNNSNNSYLTVKGSISKLKLAFGLLIPAPAQVRN
jgi:hypothetical protein